MGRTAVAALTGAIFSLGLALSGMTKPQKVVAFLDVTGDWDPSLAFVMGGAIALFAPLFFFAKRRETVAFGQRLRVPTASHVDVRLLAGSALFGAGWGLGGYCPGPALTAAGTVDADVLMFAAAMVVGMGSLPLVNRLFAGRRTAGEVDLGSNDIQTESGSPS